MTESEKVTLSLCKNSFLSFWSFPNPKRMDNKKELTDILIYQHPKIIIISVKEIKIKHTDDISVDSKRWYSKAIEKSYKQIYGAERIIKNKITSILTSNFENEIVISDIDQIEFYRIGVSIGRREGFSLPFDHFQEGFIHFFDQFSFPMIINELDTINDFIEYLKKKEQLFNDGRQIQFRSEEDLLAFYLHNNRAFPGNYDIIKLDENIWEELKSKSGFKERKTQEIDSYVIDKIIEEFFDGYSKTELIFSNDYKEIEFALRTLANENRFSRMMIAKSFLEAIGFYGESKVEARMCPSPSDVLYVFLVAPHNENDREFRAKQLQLRCMAARNVTENSIVVGIATNRYIKGAGHSYDLCYLNIPKLSSEEKKKITEMQRELGYFVNSIQKEVHYDEYPQ